jgi:hypothetical protein
MDADAQGVNEPTPQSRAEAAAWLLLLVVALLVHYVLRKLRLL